jgi:DNA-3-methyladenine glycosylase II
MLNTTSFELRFTGDYSLANSVAMAVRAAFVGGFRQQDNDGGREVLDLVFPIEGSWSPVGVSVSQHGPNLTAEVIGNPDGVATETIRQRLEHMLALDVDGEGFRLLGRSDTVVAALQHQRPGVRPILLPSPYETAARAIICHRLNVRQAATIQARIASNLGVGIAFEDCTRFAFPSPLRLVELELVAGLAEQKVEQLRALGAAAADGWLDTDRLQVMDREAAMSHLQKLAGIGPFSAELILIRGVGDSDAFPVNEMRLHKAMAEAYQLGERPSLPTLQAIAEQWSPYRSWVGLLLRNWGR